MKYTVEQKAAWDRAIAMLRENLDTPSFNAWFRPLSLYAVTSDRIIIVGQNAFSLEHMRKRYGMMFLNTIDMVFERHYKLEFHTQDEIPDLDKAITPSSTLNGKYTFENFVVGASNSFAYAASLAVAQNPSEAYNPLFIYGGVGLGKTHLMNAIGNYILANNPSANVLLMTSEAITNELIDAIAHKRTGDLRGRMRGVDVLMVDDIQFLSRTKATQEEFFHTFNDLHGNHKQIIISSDRPPKEIPEIEERLRSRFEWGLTVDIQKPDFETRMAILRQKAAEEEIDVPDDVLDYIARNVSSNIRELEGSLTSLDARSHLMGTPVTLDMARGALSHLIRARESRQVTAETIISVVADRYGVSAEDITGKRRSREIALPRQIAMYICREITDMSTTTIGQAFGSRDHTTVMHGCDKVAASVAADYAFRRQIDEMIKLIRGS